MTLTCGLYYKSFTTVTYDHNDSSLYNKTMLPAKAKLILSTLALPSSLNYNYKVFLLCLEQPTEVQRPTKMSSGSPNEVDTF